MKRIRRKLNNQTGASITYALLIFLVCAVIGSAVLVAGTAASGRMSQVAESDQRYYAVTSAARLLIDMFNEKVSVIKMEDDDGISYTVDGVTVVSTTVFDSIPKQAAYKIASGNTSGSTTFTLSAKADGETVSAASIEESFDSSNNTMVLTVKSGSGEKTFGLKLVFTIDRNDVVETDEEETYKSTTSSIAWNLQNTQIIGAQRWA